MEVNISTEDARVEAVVAKAIQYGLDPDVHCEQGAHNRLVEVYLRDGETPSCAVSDHIFQQLEGVAEVVRVTPARVSVSANGGADAHRIALGDITIGRGLPCQLIAGPCTVDQHVDTIVKRLRELGIRLIRGGCWKPRSNAYSFRGFGETAVRSLLRSAREHGMAAVFTEVLESHQIDIVRRVRDEVAYEGVVVLWVGARSVANTMLLAALGEQNEFPVMVKNGIHHRRVAEWFTQVDFVLAGPMRWREDGRLNPRASMNAGNNRVLLCVRGTEKLDPDSPFRFKPNHDWIETIHQRSWAPVGVDPSHSAGTMKGDLVLKNLRVALGFDPDFVLLEGGYPQAIRSQGLCDVEQSVPIERMSEALATISERNRARFSIQELQAATPLEEIEGGWTLGN